MPLAPVTRLGPYEIVSGLGAGGMGEVYRDALIDLEYVWQYPSFSVSWNGVLAYYSRPPLPLRWLDRDGKLIETLPIAGAGPALSPDEQLIAVERRDARTLNTDLWLYGRSRRAESRFTFTPAREAWRADGRELFYVAADGGLTSVDVAPGPTFRWSAPRALFQTMFRGGTYAPFAASKDGQRFLINTPADLANQAPIIVVSNWMARLDSRD